MIISLNINEPKESCSSFYSNFVKDIFIEEIGESFEPCMIEQIFNDEEDFQEFSLPEGEADAAKFNRDYKEIASMLEIANHHKTKNYEWLNRMLTTPAGSMLLKSKLWRSSKKNQTSADMCSSNDYVYDQVDPQQLEALLLWKSTKLPLASISCKLELMLSLPSKE